MTSLLKTALVTGANQGIGYFVAKGLLESKQFRVILACRNEESAKKAAAQLVAETNCPESSILVLSPFDLSDHATIKSSAQRLSAIFRANDKSLKENEPFLDTLINNAGFAFKTNATEPTGVQAKVTVGVNYFGTKCACENFIPLVKDGGRVINTTSSAGLIIHFKNEELKKLFSDPFKNIGSVEKLDEIANEYIRLAQTGEHIKAGWPPTTYQTSKIFENCYGRFLAEFPENKKRGLIIASYNPGYCATSMTSFSASASRSPAQGAETAIWFATASDEEITPKYNGQFLNEDHQVVNYVDGAKRLMF
jgi:carbonyl reductase 1